MFGEMAIAPQVFYDMEVDDTQHLIVGYTRRMARMERMVRRATTVLVNMWASKPVREKELWKIPFDEEIEAPKPRISEAQMVQLARFRATLNKKDV